MRSATSTGSGTRASSPRAGRRRRDRGGRAARADGDTVRDHVDALRRDPRRSGRRRARRPALTDAERTVTRAELDAHTNRLARAYAELGVVQDSFVTIGLPNGVEWFEAAIAVWKLGATPAPVSAKLPRLELEAIVELADPALVVGLETPGRTCIPAGFVPDPQLSDAPLPVKVAERVEGADVGRQHRAAEADRRGRTGDERVRRHDRARVRHGRGRRAPRDRSAVPQRSAVVLRRWTARGQPHRDHGALRRDALPRADRGAPRRLDVRGAHDDATHLEAARGRAHPLRPVVA